MQNDIVRAAMIHINIVYKQVLAVENSARFIKIDLHVMRSSRNKKARDIVAAYGEPLVLDLQQEIAGADAIIAIEIIHGK